MNSTGLDLAPAKRIPSKSLPKVLHNLTSVDGNLVHTYIFIFSDCSGLSLYHTRKRSSYSCTTLGLKMSGLDCWVKGEASMMSFLRYKIWPKTETGIILLRIWGIRGAGNMHRLIFGVLAPIRCLLFSSGLISFFGSATDCVLDNLQGGTSHSTSHTWSQTVQLKSPNHLVLLLSLSRLFSYK